VAITTWTELKASVADFAHRSDLTTQIPDFITLCEARLNDMLLLKNMESDEALTLVTSQNYVALPTGYISPIAFWLVVSTIRVPLDFVLPQQLPYNPSERAALHGCSRRGEPALRQPFGQRVHGLSALREAVEPRGVDGDELPAHQAPGHLPGGHAGGAGAVHAGHEPDRHLGAEIPGRVRGVKAAENRNRGIVSLVNDFLRPTRRQHPDRRVR
jgi:hypothetical protein